MIRWYTSFKAFVLYSVLISSSFAQIAPDTTMTGALDVGTGQVPQQPDQQIAQQQPETMSIPAGGGPETVALSQEKVGTHGNWMKKRDWLMKTNEANNELQKMVLGINAMRKTYNEKYSGIDEILDGFYKQLGQEQGKLQEVFDGIIRYLEKKKKKDITLISQNPEIDKEDKLQYKNLQDKIELVEQQVSTLKGSLDQLKLDMKSIEDLDHSVAERMKKVDEQITIANDEAAKAQKMTSDLWYIIDDKKARTYYYEIKGSTLEKIKAIDAYLKGDLLTDFDAVIDVIKTHVTKTHDDIKKLEDKGLIIKDRARRVEALKLKDLFDAELERKKAELEQQKAAEEKARKAKLPKTWYGKIYHACVNFFSSLIVGVYDFCSSLYQTLFGSKKTVLKAVLKKVPTATPVTPVHPEPTSTSPAIPATTTPPTVPAALPQALPQPPAQAPQPSLVPSYGGQAAAAQTPLQMPTT